MIQGFRRLHQAYLCSTGVWEAFAAYSFALRAAGAAHDFTLKASCAAYGVAAQDHLRSPRVHISGQLLHPRGRQHRAARTVGSTAAQHSRKLEAFDMWHLWVDIQCCGTAVQPHSALCARGAVLNLRSCEGRANMNSSPMNSSTPNLC